MHVTPQLLQYLDPGAVDRLRTYFFGPPFYTGRRFERLAGGGDRAEAANQFTADDLVAVSMLGVTVHAEAALDILEHHATEFNGLLARIPTNVDLWDVPPKVVDTGSAADMLWHRLDDVAGVGWVIAGKLLARKRPRLIPVYDRIVRNAVGAPDNWWLALQAAMQSQSLRERIEEVRAQSNVGDDISLLRVLDVAIWMTGDQI
jgi:hypothetical protein